MPPKKRSSQTCSTNPAKRPQLSRGTESREGSCQEDSSQQFPLDQLMTVNITALSASISSAVKQAVVEALAERTQLSSGHSLQAPIAKQSVADAVGASLASITQGTLQSSVNRLTLADPGQGSQAPKQIFSSVAVSLSSRVSSKIKAKIWSNEYINFGTLLSLSPHNQKYSFTVASSDSESSRPHLTLEPSQPAKKVQSITQWLSAFNIFVAIYAKMQATGTPKLMKYCETVRDIAAKPGDWLYYDKQFRFIRQSAPDQYPWDASIGNFGLRLSRILVQNPNFLQIKGICASALNHFQKALVDVSKPVKCAMGVGLTTYASNVAHPTLLHNVPLVNNTKETPLRLALQLQRHKPLTPVKVDRLNFFLTGYHPPLRKFLVNGFSYGFCVGFVGER